MSPTRKRTVTRRRPRRAKPAAVPPPSEEIRVVATPVAPSPAPEDEPPLPAEIVSVPPERDFAGRVPPPPPERPWPNTRRAIFFDVENTSQVSHIARVIDHLRVDRIGQRTDFLAVGNWRVIGHDTARLLARHGAQLIHSAPSVGVRDWSDLRIAVGAGVWLASARPGDVIEIISDDRAFDAVGDVAASLGIVYQRLSYRSLTGATAAVAAEAAVETEPRGGRGRRGRRHGRGGRRPEAPAHDVSRGRGGHRPPSHGAPAHAAHAAPAHASVAGNGGPHTAPHDELLAVVRELSGRAPGHHVTLDALANALKQRGFSRPPGSPRLITRLRRIKELEVSRSGVISLIGGAAPMAVAEPVEDEQPRNRRFEPQPVEEEQADDVDGNVAPPELTPAASPERSSGRRRRSRRGGRRHRRRGAAAPAAGGA